MKAKKMITILVLAGCFMLYAGQTAMAGSVGTAFAYQGRLIDNNQPADEVYDFQFKLYDANNAGNKLGADVNKPQVDVIDGYFTVELDFGGVFDGNERWLQIGVRPGELGDPNAYTVLVPRQKITATPYALYALNGGGSLWQVNGTSIYYNNGNVGIGTTSPAQDLEVKGGVFIDHSGGAHVPAEQGIALTVDGRAGKNILRLRDYEANTAMVVNHVGKVGIGTSSPTAKLEVNGQVRITDGSQGAGKVLTSDAGGQASWQSPTETDPTVLASVKDGISWSEVSAIPSGFADGVDDVGLTAETDPTVLASVKDGVSWGEVSGIPAGFSDGVDDVGAGDNLGNHTATQNIILNGYWLSGDGGSEGVYVTNNGNVGIGEANPVARLVVGQSGDILLKAAGEDAGDIIFQNSTGTQKGRMWGDPTAGQNMLCLSSADNTADITIDQSGNVGIGTASPDAKLEVNGNIKTVGIYETSVGDTWTAKESNRKWRSVAMSADGTKQTAVGGYPGNEQIYVSTDSGNTWTAKESNREWFSVAMSADGTKQTAVVLYGQIYVSTDSGNNWTAKESNREWVSVAMSADGTKQTAVVYGGQIYISTDSGNTWTAKESNRIWRSVAMSADGTKQTAVAAGWQIYVSTDTGNTWTAKESNRNWFSVSMSADGTKQTAVVYGGQIYISTDSGNIWTAKESNRDWMSVAMSADGTKQTAVVYGGQIYISTDSGNIWTAKESNRGWESVAMSADGTKRTAVVYSGQIYISGIVGVGIGTTNPIGRLDVNGSIYQRGVVLHADYVFEPGYKLESIDEHSEFMWQEKHLPAMPKIQKDENGQEIVEIGARSRGVVEELEKAHIYIEQLNKENKELRAKLTTLDVRLNAMESLMSKLSLQQEGGIK
jgi:hypothetical protein